MPPRKMNPQRSQNRPVMQDANINMRVRRADLDLIDRAAEIEGKSRSAFLREYAEAEAIKILSTPRLVAQSE
jgi:uncharacterized protein (DUF1778 family)